MKFLSDVEILHIALSDIAFQQTSLAAASLFYQFRLNIYTYLLSSKFLSTYVPWSCSFLSANTTKRFDSAVVKCLFIDNQRAKNIPHTNDVLLLPYVISMLDQQKSGSYWRVIFIFAMLVEWLASTIYVMCLEATCSVFVRCSVPQSHSSQHDYSSLGQSVLIHD